MNEDQIYWSNQVRDYEVDSEVGPEINSLVASSAKIYWQKALREDKLKEVLEEAKRPSNCAFLAVKRVNKDIWGLAAAYTRTRDFAVQQLQETHARATSALVMGMGELSESIDMVKKDNPLLADTLGSSLGRVMEHLQRATKLSGNLNQGMVQLRREAFKPHIPQNMREVIDEPPPDDPYLFGDDNKLLEKIKTVKTKNEVLKNLGSNTARKNQQNSKPSTSKDAKKVESSNWKTHSKPRGGWNNKGYQAEKKEERKKEDDRYRKRDRSPQQKQYPNKKRRRGNNKR